MGLTNLPGSGQYYSTVAGILLSQVWTLAAKNSLCEIKSLHFCSYFCYSGQEKQFFPLQHVDLTTKLPYLQTVTKFQLNYHVWVRGSANGQFCPVRKPTAANTWHVTYVLYVNRSSILYVCSRGLLGKQKKATASQSRSILRRICFHQLLGFEFSSK